MLKNKNLILFDFCLSLHFGHIGKSFFIAVKTINIEGSCILKQRERTSVLIKSYDELKVIEYLEGFHKALS